MFFSLDLVFYFVDELQPDGTPESVHLLPNDEILVGLRSSPLDFESKQISGGDHMNESDFSCAFKRFLNKSAMSDVVFKFPNDDGVKMLDDVYGHKVVLAARCEYFNKMFSSGCTECADTSVTVEGFSKNTMLLLLEYIYTGDVRLFDQFPLKRSVQCAPAPAPIEDSDSPRRHVTSTYSSANTVSAVPHSDDLEDESAFCVGDGVSSIEVDKSEGVDQIIQLLLCSNKYLLPELQAKCEEVLYCYRTDVLTLQNICHFMQICDRYGAMRLKQACHSYILDNMDEIKGDEQLREDIAASPELGLLLFDAMVSSSSQDSQGRKRPRLSHSVGLQPDTFKSRNST